MIRIKRLIPDSHGYEHTCFHCGASDHVILHYNIEVTTKGYGNYMRLCDSCIRRLGTEIMADVLWNVDRELEYAENNQKEVIE